MGISGILIVFVAVVFQDMHVPGILYFICGGVSVGCICALFWLPETKDSNLNDKLDQGPVVQN